MASIAPDSAGETSRQGLRRMKRLAASAATLNGIPRGIIHPTTGLMIYPGHSSASGHFIAPLDGSSSPRQLPTPPLLGLSSHITASPEGRWLILFHPNVASLPQAIPAGQGDIGGTLAIYSQQILLPFATSGNTIPHSTLPLPTAPLAILPLYPARAHVSGHAPPDASASGLETKPTGSPTRQSLAAPAGPRPPASHDSARGPVLLVLVPDGILLIHPQQAPNGEWGMNVLKSPLHTRTRVRTGDSIPVGGGLAGQAKRGWLGVVQGSEGVWVALDKGEGRVDVVKVDVGIEDRGRWVLCATPLPRAPEIPRPDGLQSRQLQGVLFVKLTDELRGDALVKDEEGQTKAPSAAEEGVAAAFISQDCAADGNANARIDVFGFERRQVQLSEAFAELSGQNDTPASWDWFTLPRALRSSIAPPGTTLLSLVPLVPTPSDATPTVALLQTPRGVLLSRLSVTKHNQDAADRWNALRDPAVELGELDVDEIVLSPAATRGGLGFVGVHGTDGIKLALAPIDDASSDTRLTLSHAASDIVLAIKSSESFTDAVQAVFAHSHAQSDEAKPKDLPVDLITRTFELLKEEKSLDRMMRVRQVQIACFGKHDEPRCTLAAEMLRLQEVSAIFGASVIAKDGVISFDLVWRLVFVVEWVYGVLARIFKESISERGRIDWGISRPVSLDMMYLLNPIPRKLLLTTLAQLNAFTAFISTLNRPILPPEPSRPGQVVPLARDVGATMLAKDRIAGLESKTGVELVKWAKAIVEVHRAASVPSDEDVQSYLRLEIRQSAEEVGKALGGLPDPSALFVMDPQTAETFDAITFQPLPRPIGAQCGRCRWRTVAVMPQMSRAVKEQGGLDDWREERKVVCGCGGAWGR